MASIALITVLVVGVQAPADEVDAFLRSYRVAVSRLAEQYKCCRIAGVSTDEVTSQGKAKPARRLIQGLEYKRVGDNEKLVITPQETRIDGQEKKEAASAGVIIRRDSTLFAIKGSGDDKGYSLAFRGNANTPIAMRSELPKNRDRFFRPSYEAPGFNLPIFLDKPELSIQSVRTEERDGERLTRVDYTIRHHGPKAPVQKAWCLLMPDAGWSLRAFETSVGGEQSHSYSGEVEYEGGQGKDAALRPKTVRLRLDMPNLVMTNQFVFDRFELGEGPAEDFSLAAYGLGEIDLPTSRPKNLLLISLVNVAVVALILGIWVRRVIARGGRDEAAPGEHGGRD